MDVFDAHCHIIDPRHPLTENQGFVPEPFTVRDYRARISQLRDVDADVVGGAVVAGSFQGFDTGWMVNALTALGPTWAGVLNLPSDVEDREILRLDAAGARAVRINLYRGFSLSQGEAERLSRRVHDLAGWHTEFYLDASDLPELTPLLRSLPQICIDHLGMSAHHEDLLVSLAKQGAVVKATGLGRIDIPDPERLVHRLLSASPTSVVFGTDLPSTRARRPFRSQDLVDVLTWAGPHAQAVVADNARRLYRLPRRG